MEFLLLSALHPHPRNPRLSTNQEVVDQIAAQIKAAGEFDPAHALIVRKNAAGYEIVSGHHRKLAAEAAGLAEIPAWVRQMSDDDAYMALVLDNAQSELHPLEEGLHAIGSKLSQSEYGKRIGKAQSTIAHRVLAAKVAKFSPYGLIDLRDHWRALSEIHVAPKEQWKALVRQLVDENWTIEKSRKVARAARAKTRSNPVTRLRPAFDQLRENISLEEWKQLGADVQQRLLNEVPAKVGSFNKQDTTGIEWAQWSWNPVTGCLHDCPYCYARDIAESARTASAFPNGFAPTFRPNSVFKPRLMKPPDEAATDTRFRNVFTCSMADLFGRWVPREWIEAVLREMRTAPNWNFLCLTKFPKRMTEFEIPPNAWMGTTVDLQARVANAEAAFSNVNSGVRWLSVEPLLEPVRFNHLERFNWIVIGGSSKSTQTPEFIPPIEWVVDLVVQARQAGLAIYMKTNLGIINRLVELPFDAPIDDLFAPRTAPTEFHYLGRARQGEAA